MTSYPVTMMTKTETVYIAEVFTPLRVDDWHVTSKVFKTQRAARKWANAFDDGYHHIVITKRDLPHIR